ncbi:MAG: hypothetical protein JWQ58_561 [Reyranella sp.]|nr:hypothetical protein [Reyranella sp.]
MNVLVDGKAHAALSPREEKDVRQFRAEESVQGTVLPAEEATAAQGSRLRLGFMILWGVVALIAAGIASLAAPADMPVVFPTAVFVIVALGAFFAFVSWRRTRTLRQDLPRRLEGLAAAGTVIGVDAAGLTVAGTTLPWSALAIEQVEFRRYSTRQAVIFTLERLVLRGPAGIVVLDPILIGNGHLLIGNVWRRMRAAA